MNVTLEDLQLFTGAGTDASAQVYVRAPLVLPQPGYSLAGRIQGPFCRHATTLSASFEIVDQGPGPCVLAKGTVADPCYWTPDLPFLYRVDLEWKTPGGTRPLGSQQLALRRFGARGRSWFLDGQRWVIRGVAQRFGADEPLAAWQETCPACLVDGLPDDERIAAAAEAGVMLIPSLRSEQMAELDRLARQTTIAACVLDSLPGWPADLRRRIPQTVFWQEVTVAAPRALAPWAQGALLSLGNDAAGAAAWSALPAPVVVRRVIPESLSLAAARAECDRLQRDLAPFGDWAGYVIM